MESYGYMTTIYMPDQFIPDGRRENWVVINHKTHTASKYSRVHKPDAKGYYAGGPIFFGCSYELHYPMEEDRRKNLLLLKMQKKLERAEATLTDFCYELVADLFCDEE